MPITKNAYLRYRIIDEILSRGNRITLNELHRKCNKRLEDEGYAPIQYRQFHNDILYMMNSYPNGYDAPIKYEFNGHEKIYYYEDPDFSILNQKITSKQYDAFEKALHFIKQNIGILNLQEYEPIIENIEKSFKMDNLNDLVVIYDQNKDLKGTQYFNILYNAITAKKVLKITYKPYSGNISIFTIHPYIIKQYNNRWYLVCWEEKSQSLYNLAFDRIEKVKEDLKTNYKTTNIDFQEYYEECIGVTMYENAKSEEILFWVSENRCPYINTKPIHPYQTEIKNKSSLAKYEDILQKLPAGRLYKLKLKLNKELITELFSFGEDLVVLSPKSLQESLFMKNTKMLELYNKITN